MIALTALAALGGVVVLLTLVCGLALAARQRRMTRQPRFSPYQPSLPARRYVDPPTEPLPTMGDRHV